MLDILYQWQRVDWHCLLQNYVFSGTNQGRTVYIYNKTNFNRIGTISVNNVSGSIVDMATYSRESQPQAASKYTERNNYNNMCI